MTNSTIFMEIFIQTTTTATIITWLNNKFGLLIPADREKEIQRFNTVDGQFQITLTSNLIMESKLCISVMIMSTTLPWKKLDRFAKEAWQCLNQEVFYACQDNDPNPFRFFKLGKKGVQEVILDSN